MLGYAPSINEIIVILVYAPSITGIIIDILDYAQYITEIIINILDYAQSVSGNFRHTWL